jgi:hypothetical protein
MQQWVVATSMLAEQLFLFPDGPGAVSAAEAGKPPDFQATDMPLLQRRYKFIIISRFAG